MVKFNICNKDGSCQYKNGYLEIDEKGTEVTGNIPQKFYEESYMDKLVSLYRAITGDTTIPSDDKVKIIEKIYALELLVERYSA